MQRLSRPVRRAILFVHVSASAAWLGTTLCLLALAVTGAVSPDSAAGSGGTASSSGLAAGDAGTYRAMKVFGDWLLAPVSLLTLATGLLLSLGTHWGLARHRWVYIKFWLTLVTTAASIFAFRAAINGAAAAAGEGRAVAAVDLLIPPSVALSAYLFMTALSVLKPWGLTRRGRGSRRTGPRGRVRSRSRSQNRVRSQSRGEQGLPDQSAATAPGISRDSRADSLGSPADDGISSVA